MTAEAKVEEIQCASSASDDVLMVATGAFCMYMGICAVARLLL